MFKITQNTSREFSLEEILVMAAVNAIDAAQTGFEHTQEADEHQSGVRQ